MDLIEARALLENKQKIGNFQQFFQHFQKKIKPGFVVKIILLINFFFKIKINIYYGCSNK